MRSLAWPSQRVLHRPRSELHLLFDVRRDLVRQHVGDPDHPAAFLTVRDDLNRRAVLGQALVPDGIDETPAVIVAIDQLLARYAAVREADDAHVAVELRIGHEAGREPGMNRAEIAHR